MFGTKINSTGGSGSTSPLNTKGDIWGYSSVDARIPVGTNGQTLIADSAQPLGVRWAAAGAGDMTTAVYDVAVIAEQVVGLTAAQTLTNKNLNSGTNTFPTFNQNTTGSAATLTTARTIGGTSFDGSANITVASATGGFAVSGGALTIGAGSVAAPALSFSADLDNGIYYLGVNNYALAAGGSKIIDIATTGVTITGSVAATNLSGTNTGDQTSVSGNAGTATALATARAIYGNNFDGTAALTQVIASTYGGTGNGFTKFTGATTSEKTYTLPNSSETLLYSGGALGTPSSGTLTNATGLPIAGITGLGTGVGTFLGTPSSANLLAAITDETGTGALVFGTSPTITTPTIAKLANLTSNGFVKTSGGDGTLSVDTSTYITGNQTVTLSGDVTGSGATAITTSIANNAVTNAKMDDMAQSTIKGRAVSAGTGDPTDLTATQATAILNEFTGDAGAGGLKGLVKAPSAGDSSKFLKGDGTWTTISGGGDALTTNPLSQFAATTSSQLAGVISDETGTGALVFATSPTLVTPILGTPTSGTLTNATGLPIAGLVASTSTAIGVGSVELGHASDTTIARVSAGVISVEGVTVDTISASNTLTNKTLTSPKIGTDISDTNGNELIKVTATGSAVNEITVANAATAGNPVISATGGDSNIGLTFTPKGTGKLVQNGPVNHGDFNVYFTEHDDGNSSTSDTIDWTLSNKHKSTLTGNCTFTFTAPNGPCNLVLKLAQDGTGSRTVTWPSAVHWSGGTAPTLTTTASKVDIITFYWDGTTYFGASSLNYTA